MNRWDSPLFTVPFDDVEPPCEAIWDAVIAEGGEARRVRPNAATVLVCLFSSFSLLSHLLISGREENTNGAR